MAAADGAPFLAGEFGLLLVVSPNSSELLQDVKVLTVNTSGDFFQEVFGLTQLAS